MPRVPSFPCPCGSGRKFKLCCGKTANAKKGAPAPDPEVLSRLRVRLQEFRRAHHADQPPAHFLVALARDFPDLGPVLARLTAEEDDQQVREDAGMMIFLATQDDQVPPALADRIAGSAAPVLLAALEDSRVSDDRKYRIVPLLAACGVELPRDRYEACFRDFASIAARQQAASMKEMSPAADSVSRALVELGLIRMAGAVRGSERTFREAFGYGAALTEHNPEAGAFFLSVAAAIAAEQRTTLSDACMALTLASRTKTPAVAWYLSELANWPGTGRVGVEAAGLVAELRQEDVLPAIHAPRTFSHGIVSMCDGVGSRNLLLCFRTPSGGMDAWMLLVNDGVGIKDSWCVYDHGSTVEKELRGQCGLSWAPLSLPLARELLEDALALHRDIDAPPVGRFLLDRALLGAEPLRIRKRQVNLGAYALEIVVRSPELAAGSERLCTSSDWGEFWFAGDAAYEFVRAEHAARKGRSGKLRIEPKLVDRFAREAAIQERDTLVRRMAVLLETESWGGRAQEPLNRLGARTWLVLSEGLVPFHEVPYVQGLAQRALKSVAENVALGFRNQREVNATRPMA